MYSSTRVITNRPNRLPPLGSGCQDRCRRLLRPQVAPSPDDWLTFGSARLRTNHSHQMGEAGFEPAKAEPLRLQRNPVDRLGTPPAPTAILDAVPRGRSPETP